MTFEEYLRDRKDIPDYIKQDLSDAQYFGPPVLIVAGFRLEELPVLRLMIDKIMGDHVKLVPVSGIEMLNMKVEEALEMPEPEWSKPRPDSWTRSMSVNDPTS